MAGSENPMTLERWQASSGAFGLYLVIGTILAFLVVGIIALRDKGHNPEGQPKVQKQSMTIRRPLNADANAVKSNMHEKNSKSSLHVNKQ